MQPSELKNRTRQFSVAVLKLVEKLPVSIPGKAVAEPLVKCGIDVGSKYRLMCRSQSPYSFNEHLGECEEAADECTYWIDLVKESGLLPAEVTDPVRAESRKLKRIFTKSRRAAAGERAEPREHARG